MDKHRSEFIDPGLSVSLDVLRFGAAVVVCVGHASGGWLTGGAFWQLGVFLHAAVMVFFVLSGYVVAATTVASKGGRSYFAARASRLLSVVIPALAITALLDGFGMWARPEFYFGTVVQATGGDADLTTALPWRYLINLLHVQQFWIIEGPRSPGTNAPFWSLSFEAVYYAMFGMVVFLRPMWAAIGCLCLLAVAGPRICVLAPIWFAGVFLWRFRSRVSGPAGGVLFCTGIAMFAVLAVTRAEFAAIDATLPIKRLWSDYWAGTATALLMGGLGALSHFWRPRPELVGTVRMVADHTFELYLVHIPVVYFVVAFTSTENGTPARLISVYGSVLAVTVLTAAIGRSLRPRIRSFVLGSSRHPARAGTDERGFERDHGGG